MNYSKASYPNQPIGQTFNGAEDLMPLELSKSMRLLRSIKFLSFLSLVSCCSNTYIQWIPFGGHPLKLERYRED